MSVSLLLVLCPWILFLLTVQGNLEHPIMAVPLPLAVLALLFWRSKKCDAQSGIATDLVICSVSDELMSEDHRVRVR